MKKTEFEEEKCDKCGNVTRYYTNEYYCDNCNKLIEPVTDDDFMLNTTIFDQDIDTHSITKNYCCWECCLRDLKKIDCNYFLNLPHLSYDTKKKGLRAKDFFEAIRLLAKE